MGRISTETKLAACRVYDERKGTFQTIASEIGVHRELVRRWYLSYKAHGKDCFKKSHRTASYSNDIKKTVIDSYLTGDFSAAELGAIYGISGTSINNWIKKYYNSSSELEFYSEGSPRAMGYKKTTFEERLEIVKWVIDNEMNCKEASQKFNVSYTTIRKWVADYQKDGSQALEHKHGNKNLKKTDLSNLSEVERLKFELQREKALRERAEFEVKILKKKEQLEKILRSRK